MATPRPLTRPPITEALIDFRVASDPAIDAAKFQGIRKILAPDYPAVQERRGVRAQIRFDTAAQTIVPGSTDVGLDGLFFKTADEHRIAQFRRDGFTLNQLPPYASADALIDEALRLWPIFRNAADPSGITRIAFRYINILQLPYKIGEDFRRFLTSPPEMPDGAPQAVIAFLSRVVAHDGDDVAIVTLNLEPTITEPGAAVPVTLDLEVSRVGDFSPDGLELRPTLNRLRELKNRIFFASLTEEAVQLFV